MRTTLLAALALFVLLALGGIWFLLEGKGPTSLAASGSPPALVGGDDDRGSAALRTEGAADDAVVSRPDRSALEAEHEEGLGLAAPEQEFDGPVLLGRVVDDEARSVAGARVLVNTGRTWVAMPLDLEPSTSSRWMRAEETSTDAEGRFHFLELNPGTVQLVVRAPGFAPFREQVGRLPAGYERHELEDVVLRPGQVVAGRVVDGAGEGIAGVQILSTVVAEQGGVAMRISGSGVPVAETAADGAFRIDELEPGPWELVFDSPGHVPRVERDEQGGAEGEAREGVVVILARGADIAGRVIGAPADKLDALRVTARRADSEDDLPLPPGFEGTDTERARHVQLEQDGAFVVRGLVPGFKHRLTLWEEDADGEFSRVRESEPVYALAGQRGARLEYRERSSLVLQVVDGETQEPIERFVFAAGTRRLQTWSAPDGEPREHHPEGRVEYDEVQVGNDARDVKFRVRAAGYAEHNADPFELAPGETKDLGVVELTPVSGLHVRVVDGATGEPVADAEVLVAEDDENYLREYIQNPGRDARAASRLRSGRTDAEGLANVAPTDSPVCLVRARADGYAPSDLLRIPKGDAQGEHELRLLHGGTVTVYVRDPSGLPVEGITVAHRWPDRSRPTFGPGGTMPTSDADGRVVFENLIAGVHSFTLAASAANTVFSSRSGPAESPEWRDVSVTEGGASEVRLEVPARGGLYGVVREGGQPLAEAQLQLQSPEGAAANNTASSRGLSARTDASGAYRFEGIAVGDYDLVVQHTDRRMAHTVAVQVLPEPAQQDIDLPLSIIEGRVFGPEGQGIEGLRIDVRSNEGRRTTYSRGSSFAMRLNEAGEMDFRPMGRVSSRVLTDEDGRYELRGVRPAEELVVRVRGEEILPVTSDPVELGPDEVLSDFDFEVALAGRIDFSLPPVDPATQRWYSVRATLVVSDGERPFVKDAVAWGLEPRGNLGGLVPGKYQVVVTERDRNGGSKTIHEVSTEVTAGRSVQLDLD